MQVTTSLLIGYVSFLLLFILGYRLIHNPKITSRRYALLLSFLNALTVFTVSLVSRELDKGLVFVSISLFVVSLAVGFPVFYYSHRYLTRNKKSN